MQQKLNVQIDSGESPPWLERPGEALEHTAREPLVTNAGRGRSPPASVSPGVDVSRWLACTAARTPLRPFGVSSFPVAFLAALPVCRWDGGDREAPAPACGPGAAALHSPKIVLWERKLKTSVGAEAAFRDPERTLGSPEGADSFQGGSLDRARCAGLPSAAPRAAFHPTWELTPSILGFLGSTIL